MRVLLVGLLFSLSQVYVSDLTGSIISTSIHLYTFHLTSGLGRSNWMLTLQGVVLFTVADLIRIPFIVLPPGSTFALLFLIRASEDGIPYKPLFILLSLPERNRLISLFAVTNVYYCLYTLQELFSNIYYCECKCLKPR